MTTDCVPFDLLIETYLVVLVIFVILVGCLVEMVVPNVEKKVDGGGLVLFTVVGGGLVLFAVVGGGLVLFIVVDIDLVVFWTGLVVAT